MKAVKYLLLPALAPVSIVILYFIPLTVISCKSRGLVAFSIALLSAIGAFAALWHGYLARFRRDPVWLWWFFRALIFTAPLALLLGPLG